MKVFSGSSNSPLVEKICAQLSLPVGKIELKTFASGERYCQFQENIRGTDVFLVQSTSHPANDNLMELLVMCDAARRSSAGRVTAVIPYFGYARQDRKEKSRVPISAKLIMDILGAAGVNRILTMELHSPQTVGFTNLPVDHLSFKPALVKATEALDIDMVVTPDIGGLKRAHEYAVALGKKIAIVDKERIDATHIEVKNFIGNVNNKNCLIIDDLTESMTTLIEAATICKERGAKDIYVAVTHGCFSKVGFEKMSVMGADRLIQKFLFSNTILNEWWNSIEGVSEVDVSPWFASAIKNIHNNESVSELFV